MRVRVSSSTHLSTDPLPIAIAPGVIVLDEAQLCQKLGTFAIAVRKLITAQKLGHVCDGASKV